MICIKLENTDPFFCLAAEEYLLKNFDDDIFMLWQSHDTVVVGKHQNAMAEINYRFVRENNITVARRISGGGTVFHDAGNVNFAFIRNVKSPSEISFKMFTEPIVVALARLGIEATTSGRNDLLIEGLKVSGNAEHVYKNRVLHHGTLLFDSDLANLGQSIKVVPGKYEGKAVQSNRSKVANISSFLKQEMPIEAFIDFLIEVQLRKTGNTGFNLSSVDIAEVEKLAAEKFSTWDWIWGYSPKYTFRNSIVFEGKTVSVEMAIEKGIIRECHLDGYYFDQANSETISKELKGKRHDYDSLKTVFENGPGIVPEHLINLLF